MTVILFAWPKSVSPVFMGAKRAKFKRPKCKIQSHFSKVNGKTIHYLTCGRGEPLILLHAYLSTARTFSGVIKYLAKNFKVYAPDFPGFGLSDELEGRPTLQESSKYLAEWIKKEGLKDFILVGVSMGGTVSVYLAREIDDRVRGYVLIEPYFTPQALTFPKSVLNTIKGSSFFFNRILPRSLGEKLWTHKRFLVFLVMYLNPLRDEVERKRPIDQKLDIVSCAPYKTFWLTLELLLDLDLNNIKNVSDKHAVLVMSSGDKSLDYSYTLRCSKRIFPDLAEIKIELTRHYPVEPITVRYIEAHYPTLLRDISDNFKE